MAISSSDVREAVLNIFKPAKSCLCTPSENSGDFDIPQRRMRNEDSRQEAWAKYIAFRPDCGGAAASRLNKQFRSISFQHLVGARRNGTAIFGTQVDLEMWRAKVFAELCLESLTFRIGPTDRSAFAVYPPLRFKLRFLSFFFSLFLSLFSLTEYAK